MTFMDIIDLFRKGSAVADPGIWKDGGNAATLLVPLLTAVVKVLGDFGYAIQLSTDQAIAIAGGITAAVHFVAPSTQESCPPSQCLNLNPLPHRVSGCVPSAHPRIRKSAEGDYELDGVAVSMKCRF